MIIYFQARGCFYHFREAVRHNIGEHRLTTLMSNCSLFTSFVHSVFALAHVPETDVKEVFEQVVMTKYQAVLLSKDKHVIANKKNIEDFLGYLTKTWLGSVDKKGMVKAPLYPAKHWNQFEAACKDLARTNNSAEGKSCF